MNAKIVSNDETLSAVPAKIAIMSVVLVAVFFVSLIAFYNIYDDWTKQKEVDTKRVLSAAEECAAQQKAHAVTTEILLRSITLSHLAKDPHDKEFQNYLRSIDGFYPGYLRFSVVSADGIPISLPAAQQELTKSQAQIVRTRATFKKILTSKQFAIGEYVDNKRFPQFGQNAVLPMAMPIFDDSRHVIAILVSIMDMNSSKATFENLFTKNNIETAFFDRNQNYLYRYPARSDVEYGTPVVSLELKAAMDGPEDKSTFISKDRQGRERLFGFAKISMSESQEPFMFAVSFTQRPSFAEFLMSEYLAQGIGTILAIFLSLLLAAKAGQHFFGLGLENLAARVNAVKSGDLAGRIAKPVGCREIRILGNGMNDMLDSLQKSDEQLRALSNTDSLTGLHNRRHFNSMAGLELKRAMRGGYQVAIAMMDLDHFKSVNDTYGHSGGDAVLRAFACILQENIRATDLVARFGGEEFIMLMPAQNLDSARAALEKIRILAESGTVVFQDQSIGYTVSIGLHLTNFSHHDEHKNMDELLEQATKLADTALYQSKEEGRNRITSL